MQFSIYAVILCIFALLSLIFAMLSWRRQGRSAKIFSLAEVALAIWLAAYGLELFATSPAAKLFWTQVSYIGVTYSVLLVLLFFLNFAGHTRWLRREIVGALLLVPTLTIVVAFLRPDWMWADYHIATANGHTYYETLRFGWWFRYIHTPYSYLAYLVALLVMVEIAFRSPRLLRAQSVGLLVTGLLSLSVNTIYIIFGQVLGLSYDFTPLLIAMLAWLSGWITLYYRMLDWTPLARQTIVTNLPDAVFLLNHRNYVAEMNPAAMAIFPHSDPTEEAYADMNLTAQELFPQEWWPQLQDAIANAPRDLDLTRTTEDGSQFYESKVVRVIDRSERRIGTLVILHDMTARRTAQRELFASQQRLQTAMAAAPMILTVFDRNGIISLTVGAGLHALDTRAGALEGASLFDIFAGHATMPGDLRRVLAGESFATRTEFRNHLFDTSFAPELDNNGQIVGGIIIGVDVTERVQIEQAIQQAQRLESLGVMAGGIAHDFNNLLAAILGQSTLALAKLPPASPSRDHIEKSVIGAERAAELTRQLLAYTGKGGATRTIFDLNRLIQDNHQLLRTIVSSRIDLVLSLAPEPTFVDGDRGQLQQIIMNLVINAAEAIGQRAGTVTLSTTHLELAPDVGQADYWGGDAPRGGPTVLLTVSDTGDGMTSEVMESIFDPFFSTKQTGTGLGLSATLGIIHAHQGGIRVDSRPGEGTTFSIYLPVADAAEPARVGGEQRGDGASDEEAVGGEAAQVAAAEQLHPQTVLVVDDEAPVLQIVCETLQLYNIRAWGAEGGEAALAIFEQQHDEIDLVLVDIQMSSMDGFELVRCLRGISPHAKIILSSGYGPSYLPDSLAALGVDGFLQKPYRATALLDTIQSLLA